MPAQCCIQVSARLLHFPDICCCCGVHGAKARFRATATRTTGKKVIRTHSRSWDFPLCKKCDRWIDYQITANTTHNWFVALVVFAALSAFAAGGLLALSFVSDNVESTRVMRLIGAVGITLCGLSGAFAAPTYRRWQQNQATADRIKPSKICVVDPVIYSSWNGTVHTFYFDCQHFADHFRSANARKVLGW